jgi:hypothetical protein
VQYFVEEKLLSKLALRLPENDGKLTLDWLRKSSNERNLL